MNRIHIGHGDGISIIDEDRGEVFTLLKGVSIKGVSYDHADDMLWSVDTDGNIYAYDLLKQRFLKQITDAGIGAGDSISVNSGIALAGGATKAVTRAIGYISIDDTIAPEAPEDITVIGGLGRIMIQWSRPNAQDIDHYKVIIKNQAGATPTWSGGSLAASYDNIYAESLTLYNLTVDAINIAKQSAQYAGDVRGDLLDKYWQVQIIVYDINDNSSQSTWVALDERTGGTGFIEQTAYLENYQTAEGVPASSIGELQAVFVSPDQTAWSSAKVNGKDSDALIGFNISGVSDRTDIQKLILEVYKGSSSIYALTEFSQRNSSNEIDPPTNFHAINLLNETDAANIQFQFRFTAVTFGGMVTTGTWTTVIDVTDTVGIDIGSAGYNMPAPSVDSNVGSVHIRFEDVIDKNLALYEIYRSPNNTWTTLGTTYEKVASLPSSRQTGANDFLVYDDNDWDNITGKIPNDKTELADSSYDGRISSYRIVGVDRFGNRYAVSESSRHVTTGAISSQYYAPAIPVDDTCVALFPFNAGVISTTGIVPTNTSVPNVTLLTDGKWGGGAISCAVGYLEYALSVVPVDEFTIDIFVRHGWTTNDSVEHFILDTSGNTSNRFYLAKTAANNLEFRVYGDSAGVYKQITYAVTNTELPKDTFNRITMRFKASEDLLSLNLNSAKVGLSGSGGSWVDPTGWGSKLFVGSKNEGTVHGGDMGQLSIWDESKEDNVIDTWHDVDRNFFDEVSIGVVPALFNTAEDHLESEVGIELIAELPAAF